jgi:hypothetical protein
MILSNIHLFCRNSLLLTGLFLVIPVNQGCEKDPEPLTTHGVIRGHAGLYDMYTDGPVKIKVTASGPYGSKSTTTSEDGVFILDGLGNGTYYLDYALEGYGTIREYSVQVFDDDTVYAKGASLFKKPESVVPKFIKAYTAYKARTFPLTTYICIEETASTNGTVFGLDLMLYMDTSEDVAWNRNGFSYPAQDAYVNDDNVHTIYVDPAVVPFESGTRVYVKGYPCNVMEYSYGYFDTYLGIPLYSTLDKSKSTNVVSFTMP